MLVQHLLLLTYSVLSVQGNNPLNIGADSWGNTIPDFSYVGYRGGSAPLPSVPVRAVLNPCATCDDDAARIQAAINAMQSLDIKDRGAILLKAGTYRVSTSIFVNVSGVVLRGQGDSTVLIATGTTQRPLVVVGLSKTPRSSAFISNAPSYSILEAQVPVGSDTVTIAGGQMPFKINDTVLITRPTSQAWINAIGMANDGSPLSGNWDANSYGWTTRRTIVAISQQKITFDVPFYMSYSQTFGGMTIQLSQQPDVYAQFINESGVENLVMESVYQLGEEDADEDHADVSIQFDYATNCWASDITTRYFVQGFYFGYFARYVTLQDSRVLRPVSIVTGGRRYAYHIAGSHILVQRSYSDLSRHDYVTNSKTQGPNVFHNCTSDRSLADTGPHQRWAFGTLYDNINSSQLNIQNRATMGSGHGWAGVFHAVWNCIARSARFQSAPFTTTWVVGFVGKLIPPSFYASQGTLANNATMISLSQFVNPASLYMWQLEQRLGKTGVQNIRSRRSYSSGNVRSPSTTVRAASTAKKTVATTKAAVSTTKANGAMAVVTTTLKKQKAVSTNNPVKAEVYRPAATASKTSTAWAQPTSIDQQPVSAGERRQSLIPTSWFSFMIMVYVLV